MSSVADGQIDCKEDVQFDERGKDQEGYVHQQARQSDLPVQSATERRSSVKINEKESLVMKRDKRINVELKPSWILISLCSTTVHVIRSIENTFAVYYVIFTIVVNIIYRVTMDRCYKF